MSQQDNVNSPKHYSDGKIEVIDFIEDKNLNFCLGNAVKYISRAGKKDASKTKEDLLKAIWYINREIKNIEKNQLSQDGVDELSNSLLANNFVEAENIIKSYLK